MDQVLLIASFVQVSCSLSQTNMSTVVCSIVVILLVIRVVVWLWLTWGDPLVDLSCV